MILLEYQIITNMNTQIDQQMTKQQIEEVNNYLNEEFLTLFLEAKYPGFTDYVNTIKNKEDREKVANPILTGTEPLIEEVKQLIKESEEDFNSTGETPQAEGWIDTTTLPYYLGNTQEEKVNNFFKLKESGISLLDLPELSHDSKLLNWLEEGGQLIVNELTKANDNLQNMYDTLAELNDDITDEEERVENLLSLLETISK